MTAARRRAAITGAASGIGAATARRLIADGWRVACLDRDLKGARATAGANGIAIELDVADEAAKQMQAGARVCMVASISSYTGGGYVATGAYATSKGAVLTMMKSCARALGERGIAVNAVAPGFIDTPFVASAMNDPVRRQEVVKAVGKVGTAEQIAECAAWLVSPAASFVHGETLIADGGLLMR